MICIVAVWRVGRVTGVESNSNCLAGCRAKDQVRPDGFPRRIGNTNTNRIDNNNQNHDQSNNNHNITSVVRVIALGPIIVPAYCFVYIRRNLRPG